MKLPEKFYVTRNYRSTEEVLGFMVVADAEHTKSFQKKKETADRWARGSKVDPIYIDNIPKFGFQIVTNVSRYSTSNVVWRVLHPEGFEFEITSHNFCDLIQTSTVIDGAIQEELFFTENKMLVSSKTRLYADLIKQEEKKEQQKELISAFVQGDKFKFEGDMGVSYKSEYLYCGSYHMLVMNKNKPLCIPEKSSKKEVVMNLSTGELLIRTKISDREIVKTGFQEVDRNKVIEKLNTEHRDYTKSSKYRSEPLDDYYVLALCGDTKPFKRDSCTVKYEMVDTKTINRYIDNYFAYVINRNGDVMRVFGACTDSKNYYGNSKQQIANFAGCDKIFTYPAELQENGQLHIPNVDLTTHQGFTGYRNNTPFSGIGNYSNSFGHADPMSLSLVDIPEGIMLGRLQLGK